MRAYAIKIFDAPSAFTVVPGSQVGAQWDTSPNGINNPEAQDVEFSLEEIIQHQPGANCQLTIHGVSFDQIKQTADINQKIVTIWGGMSTGLPLATAEAQYRGELITGRIQQAWGNWVGTEMSIGMVIVQGGTSQGDESQPTGPGTDVSQLGGQIPFVGNVPPGGGHVPGPVMLRRTGPRSLDRRGVPFVNTNISIGGVAAAASSILSSTGFMQLGGGIVASLFGGGGSIAQPLNLIHNMMPNTSLSDAIKKTLSVVFPKAKLNINISPNLKLPYQDAGMYQSMQQYASYVKQLSHSIINDKTYQGVKITARGNTINVWDGTKSTGSVKIQFIDLIGQPTWLAPKQIQVKVVMRSDVYNGVKITLPPSLQTVTPGAGYFIGAKSGEISFQGEFTVQKVTHIGNFRNPDGNSWCTIIDALEGSSDSQEAAAEDTDKSDHSQNPTYQQYTDAVKNITGPAPGTPGPGKPGESPVIMRSARRY